MTERHIRSITVHDDDWMSGGADRDHLTAILVINGTFHHLEAIRVLDDDDGHQHATSPDFADSIDVLYALGGDGPFDSVTIHGASYVLVVIPFP